MLRPVRKRFHLHRKTLGRAYSKALFALCFKQMVTWSGKFLVLADLTKPLPNRKNLSNQQIGTRAFEYPRKDTVDTRHKQIPSKARQFLLHAFGKNFS